MAQRDQYAQTEQTSEHYSSAAETQIQKEWQWLDRLPKYSGEYSQKINEMANSYQHAVNLEIEARRITSGLEEGNDQTLDVTAEDQIQSKSLRAQAYDLRLESVNQAKALYLAINKRWPEEEINKARNERTKSQTPDITKSFSRER